MIPSKRRSAQTNSSSQAAYRKPTREQGANDGLLELLLACPVKDWYEEFEFSETTDDVVKRIANRLKED